MARQSVTKHKVQTMAQEKREHKGKHDRMSRQPSGSSISLSDRETRAKATIEDIEQLYSALQRLVPTQVQQQRRKARATTSGTYRRESEDFETPRRNINNNKSNGNMRSIETILDMEAKEMRNKRVSIDDRMFASDSELTRHSSKESLPKLNRHMSLPAYDDDSATEMTDGNATEMTDGNATEMADGNATEMADGNDGASPKRSTFSIFRRRRRPKTPKKKRSSWRNLLDTLSFKRRSTKNLKKSKKDGTSSEKEQQDGGALSHEELTTKRSVHTSHNILTTPVINGNTAGQSLSKPEAPEPPVEENMNRNDSFLENIMKTRSDEVNKKLKSWYKHVVKETKSLNTLAPRYSRSCESLLTDSEILRSRGTYSTDTASSGGMNDIQSRVNLNKVRIRKSRAKRNRRKERARWQSLPNVKLVSCALNMANKKAESAKSIGNDTIKEKEPTEVPNNPKFPTNFKVNPVEAKISFGNSLEKDKTAESPINDFMLIQKEKSSRWLSRQCSKTTISCIRPLQLNLFYSESPSREAIFRCKKINCEKPKFQFKDAPKPETTEGISSTVNVRRTSVQRRRKRRSFKRQPRLPHQSPFYLPPSNSAINSPSNSPSKFPFSLGKENWMEDEQTSKDSGIGSPEYHKKNVFRLQPINTSEGRRTPKLYSESEDSGWASMDKSQVDTKIQIEPTTAGSTDRGLFQLHSLDDSDGQSKV